jgi:hypothetical protein
MLCITGALAASEAFREPASHVAGGRGATRGAVRVAGSTLGLAWVELACQVGATRRSVTSM